MAHEYKLEQDPYYPIREDMIGALERYVNHKIEPGSFLMSVLANDLQNAAARADFQNRPNLANIAQYIYFHLPFDSWGSYEAVQSWLKGE